ncbi:penicillin-binding protein [Streptomyces sp. ISL-1]|uniref:transglycosylase domain-containing protein n=1 Tax=Streptomyces sp. ISL-1 TaxID=2817657 RepID=UPI001BEAF12F|nr:transglycosylase domain-containing protein [Streptomyces sp. ISL-1]MBT2391952.1 penicillin-binding protein [Streptomyces sp. ISL-1]
MRTRWSPDRTAGRQKASEVSSEVNEAGASGESRGAHGEARIRRQRWRAGKRTGAGRFLTWKRALACVVTLIVLLAGGFTVLYVSIDIPQANELAKAQSNVYLYSDGTRLARTGETNRETVPLSRVPLGVQHAFVAAENKDFYSDSGVSLSGTARGILSTLTGKGKQGGSTITQQYVKNYYLSQEQTITRKVKELVISLKVDRQNSKDDILAGYLNSSYYGRLAYGVQAAARAYYHREVEELSVEQGAYLAALLQAPSQYDWAIAGPQGKQLVTERWNYVLDNMVDEGWLDKGARQRMKFPEPVAPTPGDGLSGQSGYLVDAARRELMASGVSEQELAGGGWRITLNIDPDKQRALEQAVTAGLGEGADAEAEAEPGGGVDAEADTASDEAAADGNRQAGAVSVDPRSGRIVALYGGRDYTRHYLSNATRSDYQAGPTFDPVAVAASMEVKTQDKDRYGTEHIEEIATALGMDVDPGDFASPDAASLGLMGASPLELAGVYASFHHEGRKVTPSIVKSAERDGEGTRLRAAIGGQAIDPRTAGVVNSYLSGGGRGGVDRPFTPGVSEQTVTTTSGRTDDRKAEWFVGSTDDLVTAIGLFGEDATTHKQVALKNIGDGYPARIWSGYTSRATLPAQEHS